MSGGRGAHVPGVGAPTPLKPVEDNWLIEPVEEPVEAAADDVSVAIDEYNSIAERIGTPTCRNRSPARRSRIKARLKDAGGLNGWRAALEKVEANPFFAGGGDSGWRVHIDYFTRAEKFAAILEGAHDRRPSGGGKEPRSRLADYADMARDYETKGPRSDVDAVADAMRRRGAL